MGRNKYPTELTRLNATKKGVNLSAAASSRWFVHPTGDLTTLCAVLLILAESHGASVGALPLGCPAERTTKRGNRGGNQRGSEIPH